MFLTCKRDQSVAEVEFPKSCKAGSIADLRCLIVASRKKTCDQESQQEQKPVVDEIFLCGKFVILKSFFSAKGRFPLDSQLFPRLDKPPKMGVTFLKPLSNRMRAARALDSSDGQVQ